LIPLPCRICGLLWD